MRQLLIRYLRWSARRHWPVKVMTIFLVLPIWVCTPGRAWDKMIEETFL